MRNELLKGLRFTCIEDMAETVRLAVDFYNNERPHMSVNMMTPPQAAFCESSIEKLWTSYRERCIRKRMSLEIPEKTLPLFLEQGSFIVVVPQGNL